MRGCEQIGLVECEDDAGPWCSGELGGALERLGNSAAGVDHAHEHIRVSHGREGGVAHGGVQRVLGFEQPGRIENDHLRLAFGANADDAMAGTLRLA